MAGTLKRIKAAAVGTVAAILTTGTETGPAVGKVWNVPRLYLCNVTAGIVKVTVTCNGGTAVSIVKTRSIAANDTIILENITLINGDSINILSDTATSIDAFGSVIEEDA